MSIINNHVIDQNEDGTWFVVFPDSDVAEKLKTFDEALELVEMEEA